jgi:phenylacetate-CoA ligase
MNDLLHKLYNSSPGLVQTCFLNLFAYRLNRQRFGRQFENILRWFEESGKWTYEELKSYQEERLRSVITHAYDTVPFYNESMKRLKMVPSDIKTISDLNKLPVLTKEDIKKNLGNLISSKFNRKDLIHGHTSGTTGSPLDVYWDIGMVVMNNAIDWRQKKWAGFSPGDPHAVILGRVVVPIEETRPPFWRMNYIQNQLWMSAFHMSAANLPLYIDKIIRFKPKFLEGYPSTMYILANYLVNNNISIQLDAVITSAETLFPQQRETIEKAFKCKIYDFYGMAERVVFATECNVHDGKHLNLEYGITEIIDKNGNPADLGTPGKIVGTSLHNFGMPLIRYQTNDVTSIKPDKCECGLNHPLIESVTTKHEDIVITPDGRWISPSVLTHPFKPQKNIVESQIIQERSDLIIINIVKKEAFNENDKKSLLESLLERLGGAVEIRIEFVNAIPREISGKFRWVISKVNRN